MLRQKARAQRVPVDLVDPTASLEPLDVYLRAGLIDERQHRAATRFRALRRSVIGPAWPDGVPLARLMVAEQVTADASDDGRRTMTDDELADRRSRRRDDYLEAVDLVLDLAGRDGLRAVLGLVVDGCDLPGPLLGPLRTALSALADLWQEG